MASHQVHEDHGVIAGDDTNTRPVSFTKEDGNSDRRPPSREDKTQNPQSTGKSHRDRRSSSRDRIPANSGRRRSRSRERYRRRDHPRRRSRSRSNSGDRHARRNRHHKSHRDNSPRSRHERSDRHRRHRHDSPNSYRDHNIRSDDRPQVQTSDSVLSDRRHATNSLQRDSDEKVENPADKSTLPVKKQTHLKIKLKNAPAVEAPMKRKKVSKLEAEALAILAGQKTGASLTTGNALAETIEVVLNDRLGTKTRVKCRKDDTIGQLKQLAAMQIGCRPEKIRLQKWYNIFKDHIPLEAYEIHDGMSIELYYN